jgi:hypothetical protein
MRKTEEGGFNVKSSSGPRLKNVGDVSSLDKAKPCGRGPITKEYNCMDDSHVSGESTDVSWGILCSFRGIQEFFSCTMSGDVPCMHIEVLLLDVISPCRLSLKINTYHH